MDTEAKEMCNSVTRKIAISSRCNFSLYGMSSIVHEIESLTCVCTTNDSLELSLAFNSDIDVEDMFLHVRSGMSGELLVVQKLITSRLLTRVLVFVNKPHVPTLKLLRAMGVNFIVSLRDSLENIGKLLHDSSIANYMSPDLQAVIKTIQPKPAWATAWGAYDGVKYLTPTEMEIIIDLLQGISPWQVARKRFISVKTISTHKINALKKWISEGLMNFLSRLSVK